MAEALGVLPGAVKITCSGEILTELREDLHASPCHAAVDQEQMAFAKQWEIMKQQMPLLDKQTLVLARLRHEHDLKLMELNLRVGGRSESAVKQAEWTLKEGGLSLQEEMLNGIPARFVCQMKPSQWLWGCASTISSKRVNHFFPKSQCPPRCRGRRRVSEVA